MSIEKVTSRYELLIRFAENGEVKGAHQIHQTIMRDMETGEVVAHQVSTAMPVNPADVADVLGEHNAAIAAQLAALVAERDDLAAEKARLESLVSSVDDTP